ncbi:serine/threonine-protein kinase [Sorangium sp. So ce260]|uniref:serine/threonine-protein kinase n=1 Tax=Sorangium sp. So ce260 TaxID=3133291 RepID=UPI003F5D8FC6
MPPDDDATLPSTTLGESVVHIGDADHDDSVDSLNSLDTLDPAGTVQSAATGSWSPRDAGALAPRPEAPDEGDSVPREELQPGALIARRYRVVERLGGGAHGQVWTADDLVLRQTVALKWMSSSAGSLAARVRREVAALRMLRIPGVVRLLDEGVERGRPFLVMERVDGRPFPGNAAPGAEAPPRRGWAAVATPALALLEVLARVHAAGIVHRDLKPDNVLVDAAGRSTVLDFGVSLWSEPGARLTGAGQIVGTPLYLAPEQIFGTAVDSRADLYAVGVMLYEALTGRVPHETGELGALLRARLSQPVLPVHELAPEVPAPVADAIDRLLSRRPEDRFRSATEALAALHGRRAALREGPELPRLGDPSPLQAAIEAGRARRPLEVSGPPGSGRSRCLRDAAEALEQEGLPVVRVRPARSPFASLAPLLGAMDENSSRRLEEVTASVERRLREALDSGVVLVADDVHRLDPWSAAALERCRPGGGALLHAGGASMPAASAPAAAAPAEAAPAAAVPGGAPPERIVLRPLEEEALRPLFAGPDRLFHLREDAARALWQRTAGVPARLDAEVTLWVRLGLARWNGPALSVGRDALDRIDAGLREAMPAGEAPSLDDDPYLDELLRWLALAGHELDVQRLAAVIGQVVWKIEAGCDELVRRGAARRLPGDRVEPIGQVDITWPTARRITAHRAVAAALRPGQEGRLFHLLAGDEGLAAAFEALAVARARAREGALGRATGLLGEGLLVARRVGTEDAGDVEVELLAEWVKVAFAEGTPRALDRVLYELSRAEARGVEVDRLAALVRAALVAPGASGDRALELAGGVPPFADAELERRRHGVQLLAAATRPSTALLEESLAEVAAWADRTGHPMARLCLAEGRARLRYVQGRFEEAAALHAEAAGWEPWLTGRIAATLSSASALLEAFQHREAAARAASARDLSARCRNAYLEGRAAWLMRAAAYRRGEGGPADLELVEAAGQLGVPQLEALLSLTEAAVAFRAGERAIAADLAGRAASLWRQLDRASGALLSRCLSLAAGAPAREGEIRELSDGAIGCRVPGIGLQALGLLGSVAPEARPSWREALGPLSEGIPPERWGERMDVLSAAEALAWATGAAPDERGAPRMSVTARGSRPPAS